MTVFTINVCSDHESAQVDQDPFHWGSYGPIQSSQFASTLTVRKMLPCQTTQVHSGTTYIMHFSVIANMLKLTKIEICVLATVYKRGRKRQI